MIGTRDLADAWVEFQRHWKLFLAIHLAAGLFVAAVLGPALSAVLGWLVLVSGDSALTDQDILRAALSPLGFVAFLVGVALVISVAVFETAAMLLAAWRLRRGERVSLWRLGRFLVWRFAGIVQLGLLIALRVLLLAGPFLAVAGWIYLRFLTEFDINYYLSRRPPVFYQAGGAILVVLLVMLGLLLRQLSGWVLSLPLLLMGHGRAATVLARSRDLVAPHRRQILRFLVTWCLVFGAGYALSTGVLKLGGMAAVALAGESLRALAWMAGGLVLAWSALNVLIGLFAGVSLAVCVMLLYARLVDEPPPEAGQAIALLDSGRDWRTGGRLTLLALGAVVVLAGVAVFTQLRDGANAGNPQIMAHRGASYDAPENTLASIQGAIDQGADWVEIDVQETREGNIVVIHDRDLMKVAGVPLAVFDTPLDELRGVDIGSYRDPHFADQRVPLLSEVLELARGRIRVNIELKYYGRERRLEAGVAELVEAHGMVDDVVLMSLSLPGVRAMKALRPAWSVGLLSSVALGDVTRLDADFFAVNARFASREFIDRAHRRDKQVLVWTVNDPAGMSAMSSKGVDGIITDRPGLAAEALAQWKSLSVHERLLVQLASILGSDFGESP